jgi:hypothetical protein
VDGVHNANFDTAVEGLPSQPARLVDPSIPRDGGFGTSSFCPNGGIGNCTFNTPVLVEAADTGPFFHNNSIRTIEGAVAFYNSGAFNGSPGAFGLAFIPGGSGPGIKLETTEVEAVAAFLRVINALENLRSVEDLLNRAKGATNSAQAKELLSLGIAELDDATRVLAGGGLHPEAQQKLQHAVGLVEAAMKTPGKKNGLIKQALALYAAAEADLKN